MILAGQLEVICLYVALSLWKEQHNQCYMPGAVIGIRQGMNECPLAKWLKTVADWGWLFLPLNIITPHGCCCTGTYYIAVWNQNHIIISLAFVFLKDIFWGMLPCLQCLTEMVILWKHSMNKPPKVLTYDCPKVNRAITKSGNQNSG